MMKRVLSILLALVLVGTVCLAGLSENGQGGFGPSDGGQNGGFDPSNGDGGSFGPSDGTQGGDFDPSSGDGGGFGLSDGTQGGFPDGMTMPDGGFSGMPSFGQEGSAEGQLGSWSMGGTNADSVGGNDYAYDAALFVTAEGVDDERSALDRIASGAFDGTAASGITVSDAASGHNGVIVVNADYTVSGASIELLTDADGTDTCDFSGKGAAVAAFGENAHVILEDSAVHTAGVATMPLFADGGATLTVKRSTLQSDGGTLYKEYLSTPDQKLMVAPPWILGIMGNSRCLNLMGNGTTVNVLDSETSAGAWAVLSTDSGTNMYLNVYNSSLTLNNFDESQRPLQAEGGQITETLDNPYTVQYGSGYGSFVIGSAVETFAGADSF